MANLGYIGLGAMGGRTADRLLAKGHMVIGHNCTKSKAQWLLDKGMQWGDSPRAIANQFLTAARGLGLEKEDCAVLFHVLAKISGAPA